MPISPSTVVVIAKDVVACELGDEAAMLNLASGVYYGLDPVGARIWKYLESPVSVGEIRDRLLEAYDVEPERCEADLVALIEKLAAEGLVEVRGEQAS
jgi:hypothetical protein